MSAMSGRWQGEINTALDVFTVSLLPLLPGPLSQFCAATVAAILLLPFLLLKLSLNQDFSATVLSNQLLQSCHSHCHKSCFSLIPSLSLPS